MYTGKEIYPVTGLYYFNARWYDPELGRFITEDPVKDGLNWYRYCSNNPLYRIDPTGLRDLPSETILINERGISPETTPTIDDILYNGDQEVPEETGVIGGGGEAEDEEPVITITTKVNTLNEEDIFANLLVKVGI